MIEAGFATDLSLNTAARPSTMHPFLATSQYIDHDHPLVRGQAAALAAEVAGAGAPDTDHLALIRRCFEFVRDEIRHSWDFQANPVTCRASDALRHTTGFCYAKSHLLAALLRANGIPAGLCYQRISLGDGGAPYCLHGLNAVFLPAYGWYRLDSRGNKPGVAAAFCPPTEALAFPIRDENECDLPEIWAEPLALVTDVLERYDDIAEVYAHLPDITLLTARRGNDDHTA